MSRLIKRTGGRGGDERDSGARPGRNSARRPSAVLDASAERERQLRIGGRIGRSFKDDERLLAMSSGKATERRVIQGTNHGIVVVVEFPVE